MDFVSYIGFALDWITLHLPNILAALVIILVGKWLARKITGLMLYTLKKKQADAALIGFLESVIFFILFAVVIIAALGQIGINTASLLTIFAAAGLAVGLALKDSLSNFASGIMLILFKPFKAGDYINAAGVSGTVQQISIFNTILHSPDNQKIFAPNSSVANAVITNVTANDTRRVDLVVGISYDDDIRSARAILEKILAAEDRLLKDPAPQITVAALADSSVNLNIRPWVKTSDYWGVYFDLIEQIKIEFDKNGITIPYPQRDVHMFSHSTEPA